MLVFIRTQLIFVHYTLAEIQKTEAKIGVYKYGNMMGPARRAEHDDWVEQELKTWNRILDRNKDLLEKVEQALTQGMI